MKKLLLITVLLVLITTKSTAQEANRIELKKIDNNQFKIKANEETEIKLKFKLANEADYQVHICTNRRNKVLSKKHCKEGDNKIAFTMEEGEQYIIKFSSEKPIKLVTATYALN